MRSWEITSIGDMGARMGLPGLGEAYALLPVGDELLMPQWYKGDGGRWVETRSRSVLLEALGLVLDRVRDLRRGILRNPYVGHVLRWVSNELDRSMTYAFWWEKDGEFWARPLLDGERGGELCFRLVPLEWGGVPQVKVSPRDVEPHPGLWPQPRTVSDIRRGILTDA